MQPDADATAELADLAATGELTLRVAETVPLERFRDAYLRLERGGAPWSGSLVADPVGDRLAGPGRGLSGCPGSRGCGVAGDDAVGGQPFQGGGGGEAEEPGDG